uniref:Putative innexin n=1 Tax=Ixodes ricinus TaxID=34613 RepID=A0A0K8R491_IXORI
MYGSFPVRTCKRHDATNASSPLNNHQRRRSTSSSGSGSSFWRSCPVLSSIYRAGDHLLSPRGRFVLFLSKPGTLSWPNQGRTSREWCDRQQAGRTGSCSTFSARTLTRSTSEISSTSTSVASTTRALTTRNAHCPSYY